MPLPEQPPSLRPPAVPRPPALPLSPSLPTITVPVSPPVVDALGSMLSGSTRWTSVPTSVSRVVTATSWGVLVLGALALVVAAHVDLVAFAASAASSGPLALVGVVSGGFRRASRGWLRVWYVALVLTSLATVAVVVMLLTR